MPTGDRIIEIQIITNHFRYSKGRSEVIGDKALDDWAEETVAGGHPVVIHFDEKHLSFDFDNKKDSAAVMMTTLSSPDSDHCQLTGATIMEETTGVEIAGQVHVQVEGVDVAPQVIAAVADTTNPNFGVDEGAMYHLQRNLGRPILEVPCGHHVEQLVPPAVVEAVSGRESTGPKDPLLSKWKESWNLVMAALEDDDVIYCTFDWEAVEGTEKERIAKEVLKWAREAKKKENFSRDDYLNTLNLLLLFLGDKVECNMPRPCAVSKARFLQVGLYYLQMWLLSDLPIVQQILTPEELQEVETVAEFVALHYVSYMLQAKYGER